MKSHQPRISARKREEDSETIEWNDYPRIDPGTYRAYCKFGKRYRDPGFQRWTCLLRWDVLSDDSRQQEGASNATVNRELAALKRMFRIGVQATPPKVMRMPSFPHMKENNVRKGFLEDEQFRALVVDAELWFRALVECGRTYGWRVSELIEMRVEQVDLMQKAMAAKCS